MFINPNYFVIQLICWCRSEIIIVYQNNQIQLFLCFFSQQSATNKRHAFNFSTCLILIYLYRNRHILNCLLMYFNANTTHTSQTSKTCDEKSRFPYIHWRHVYVALLTHVTITPHTTHDPTGTCQCCYILDKSWQGFS